MNFFPTAAAAAEAGYRPCLRCRPETAPGTPAWAGTSITVQRGLRLIARGALINGSVEDLSDRLGVTSRHLRRLFHKHLGASPQAVANTQRLHFAKRLIDETRLPLNQVAEAAGYGSVRRFNDDFLNCYGRTPGTLRRFGNEAPPADPAAPISVTLPYRRPFDWSAMLHYLAARATPGVESVEMNNYRRSYRLGDCTGVLDIRPDSRQVGLHLTLHGMNTAGLFETVQRAREMLDLDAPVQDIAAVLKQDPLLASRLESAPGIRVPGGWDGFELAVRTILGQQVSVAGATTLAGRVAEAWGEPLGRDHQPDGGPCLLFPRPERLATARLEHIGVVRSRAAAIRSLAARVEGGDIDFGTAQDPRAFARKLTSIKGIGDWTAAYLSMRVLRNPDAFPAADLGLRKAVEPDTIWSPTELKSRAEDWRPWRAYAAMLLWQGPNSSGG